MKQMRFVMCEVDPSGVYDVSLQGEAWVVERCGVMIGELPERLVKADGPLQTATMLIGYGAFVSRRLFCMGPAGWAADGFDALVDAEVEAIDDDAL